MAKLGPYRTDFQGGDGLGERGAKGTSLVHETSMWTTFSTLELYGVSD